MQERVQAKGLLAGLERLIARVKEFIHTRVLPWAQEKPSQAAMVAGGVTVGGLLWVGGSIIVNGVIAGTLVAIAAGILLYKLGHSEHTYARQAYNTIVKHPLASDVAITAVAFLISPAGITGWISCSVCALLASAWLLGASEVALVEQDQELIPVEATVL